MELTACFVTGHRPSRFKFKYNENRSLCKKIKRALTEQIKAYYERGSIGFVCGIINQESVLVKGGIVYDDYCDLR